MPESAFEGDVPLAVATRGGHVESLHRGTVAVVTPEGELVAGLGNGSQRTFMRSSAKPFQAMALVLTGAADALELRDEDLAIAASSHSGEPGHVTAVKRLLEKAGVPPEALRCGTHTPLNASAARALQSAGEDPSPVHNNCSGKHAGMLAACCFMGWPLDTYLQPDHPLQRLNREVLGTFVGRDPSDIDLGVDGCGVPVFHVAVREIALAFARLATGRSLPPEFSRAASRVRTAMMTYPFLVAGTGRFDTELMSAADGRLVAKGGAQGGEGIGALDGVGIGIKISDGSSQSMWPVAGRLLERLDLSTAGLAGQDHLRRVELRNHAGTVTGAIEACFS